MDFHWMLGYCVMDLNFVSFSKEPEGLIQCVKTVSQAIFHRMVWTAQLGQCRTLFIKEWLKCSLGFMTISVRFMLSTTNPYHPREFPDILNIAVSYSFHLFILGPVTKITKHNKIQWTETVNCILKVSTIRISIKENLKKETPISWEQSWKKVIRCFIYMSG